MYLLKGRRRDSQNIASRSAERLKQSGEAFPCIRNIFIVPAEQPELAVVKSISRKGRDTQHFLSAGHTVLGGLGDKLVVHAVLAGVPDSLYLRGLSLHNCPHFLHVFQHIGKILFEVDGPDIVEVTHL